MYKKLLDIFERFNRPELILILPVVILLGVNLFANKFFLGIEYASANVIEIGLSEPLSESEVKSKAEGIREFSKIESYNNNTFKIYFQGATLDELRDLKDDFESKIGSVSTYQVLIYKPTTLVLIANRIYYGIYVGILIYVLYLANIFRKSGITRERLLEIIVTDLILLTVQIGILAGSVNILGYSGLKLSSSLITISLGVLLLSLTQNIIISKNVTKDIKSNIVSSWNEECKRFANQSLKILIIFFIAFLMLVWVISNNIYFSLIVVLFFLYSGYLYSTAKPVLLGWIISGLSMNKIISKNKFLKKAW